MTGIIDLRHAFQSLVPYPTSLCFSPNSRIILLIIWFISDWIAVKHCIRDTVVSSDFVCVDKHGPNSLLDQPAFGDHIQRFSVYVLISLNRIFLTIQWNLISLREFASFVIPDTNTKKIITRSSECPFRLVQEPNNEREELSKRLCYEV